MLHCYYYPSTEVGLSEYAPGYFKFNPSLIAPTDDPYTADCFVLPTDLKHVSDSQILGLSFLKGNEKRHVFFTLSEYPDRALPVNALAFRTDHNESLRLLGNTLARVMPWGVEDLGKYVKLPESGFQYDIHAQMWASSPITDVAVDSCKAQQLKVHDQRNNFFYGHLETAKDPRLDDLRRTFLESMQASRLVLVPRSRPRVNRYRFFEAMSMGRVPVLLGDGCLLPCADKIDYQRCCIRISEQDTARVGYMLKVWLHDHTMHELVEMGLYGRAMWQRWLNPERWESTWATLTIEHLEKL